MKSFVVCFFFFFFFFLGGGGGGGVGQNLTIYAPCDLK